MLCPNTAHVCELLTTVKKINREIKKNVGVWSVYSVRIHVLSFTQYS